MTDMKAFLRENSEQFRVLETAQRAISSLPDAERKAVRDLVRMALRDGFLNGAMVALQEQEYQLPGLYADRNLPQYTDQLPLPEEDQHA
jgi:hypothetical protein